MVEIIAGALVAAGLLGAAYLLSRGRTHEAGNGASAADLELADQRAKAREAGLDRRAAELEKRAAKLEAKLSLVGKLLDLQKKAAAILGIDLASDDES